MKKKDPNEDEFNQDDQDNINEADDSFGLPDLDFNTLDEESEQESKEADAESSEEAVEPVTEEDEVVDEAVEEPEADDQQDDGSDDDITSERDEGADKEDGNEEETDEDTGKTRTYVPPKPESNAPKLIAALVITVLVSIGIWYFAFYRPQAAAAEKAKLEQLRKDEAVKRAAAIKADEERKAEQAARDAAAIEESEAAESGTFSIITEPTGRYYIVIESFVDSDMAADYGKELAGKGMSTALLSPQGKRKFHRLTVGDFGSFVEAQEDANKLKAEFGDDLWVLKY